MKVTLWGDLATMVKDSALNNSGNHPTIAITTGTYVKTYKDMAILSTSNASRVLNVPKHFTKAIFHGEIAAI